MERSSGRTRLPWRSDPPTHRPLRPASPGPVRVAWRAGANSRSTRLRRFPAPWRTPAGNWPPRSRPLTRSGSLAKQITAAWAALATKGTRSERARLGRTGAARSSMPSWNQQHNHSPCLPLERTRAGKQPQAGAQGMTAATCKAQTTLFLNRTRGLSRNTACNLNDERLVPACPSCGR